MAASFVGEAFLSSALGTIYDMLISPIFINLFQRKKLDRRLVENLETVLKAANAVINDAERRQIEEDAVKDWLDRLKDAVYDAEDVLDEVATKAATQKDPGNSLSRYFNLRGDGEIVTKIEEIIAELESIVREKDGLGLKEIPVEDMSWRIPSTSLVDAHQIYGRDQDREAIVKLLLDHTNDCEISVIPIVGMGGIGKTTLAQMVYNDDRVQQKFDIKAWICDGKEEFDVIKVTKAMMEATSSFCNSTELNTIQESLKKVLAEKKVLIVLDDMWGNNYDAWMSFLKPFKYIKGVKILVTTRLNSTADMVKTIPTYILSFLDDDDCWSVFADHACLNSAESQTSSALEVVGRKIVKKCNGLALAAQTLGGLLRARKEVVDWEFILNSDIWELPKRDHGILPALRISYHYLPSYLKRCFVYCSLFPKDYEFRRNELVLLWMAEGLLQQPKSCGSTLEEVGHKYFNDLASRSFFQPSKSDENSFMMHDLMHDLAIFYGGKFFSRTFDLEAANKHDVCPRHLSFDLGITYSFSKILEACDSSKNARTFLGINNDGYHDSSEEIDPFHLLARLKHLRILSSKSFLLGDHDSLLNSIGDLIHLRYLDLSGAPIETLPESMSKLYNLQTLKLNQCSGLRKLPSKMQDLVNLRHLDIEDTSLEEMPKGMSKLKELQFLSHYVVGKHEENGIEQLGELVNLQGSLSIENLENIVVSSEAWKARMVEKKYINGLCLEWSSGIHGDSQIGQDVLAKLEPHNDLKSLTIKHYKGTMFPDWIGHSSYHMMTKLELIGCQNCWVVPSLGQLPSLETLIISNFNMVKKIGGEFYKAEGTHHHQETPFRSLKTLKFYEMGCWEEWESFECGDDDHAPFPQLEYFSIKECPKLRGDLPSFLPSLKKLWIKGCSKLGCYLPRAPIIRHLRMRELSLSMLETLCVNGDHLVECVFDAITRTQPTSLRELYISRCSSAISFPGDSLPPSLKQLYIYNCKNVEFPMQHQQHHSLKRLEIGNSCHSLTSLALPFPNLGLLKPIGLENLTSLEVSQSQCLRELLIEKCPKLGKIRVPASLRELRIIKCPLLGESIERKDPHIWPTVSHVHTIQVDGKLINK